MLTAIRKADGKTVFAYFERKSNGPFSCRDCGEGMILRTGRHRVDYFAHANPLAKHVAKNESDLHRRCKREIYDALCGHPDVRDVALEKSFGPIRPDIFARIKGVPVAIEVQISSLSEESIVQRTIWYHRKGIYVLWLLPWISELDHCRYAPRRWEFWIHTTYFGSVYYWRSGLHVQSCHFHPYLTAVPRASIVSKRGKKTLIGGYTKRSKRYRTPVRGLVFHLVNDFEPIERRWWEGGGLKVPDAKLYSPKRSRLQPKERKC